MTRLVINDGDALSPAEAKALREREAQRLQRYSLCADCRAGLIVNNIDGEWRAVCSKERLAHAGYIKMGTVAGREERRRLTRDQLLREGKMTETAIVSYKSGGTTVELSVPEVMTLINTNASEKEAEVFIRICQAFQVNPYLGEAYLIKYSERDPAAFVIGSAAFLRFAQSHPQFDGMAAGVIYTKGSEGSEPLRREGAIIYPGETLIGGWAEVHRKDRRLPAKEEVAFDRWVKRTREGKPTRFWAEMPEHQIRKVALHHALKFAFPGLFMGLGESDENDNITVDAASYEVTRPRELTEAAVEPSASPETPQPTPASAQEATAPSVAEGDPSQMTAVEFWEGAKEMGFDTTKVPGFLKVKDMDEWLAQGRTYGDALADLRELKG